MMPPANASALVLPAEVDDALLALADFVQPPPNVLYQHSLKGMAIHEFASRYNYLETGVIGHLFPIHVVITDAMFNPWRYGLGQIKTSLYSCPKKCMASTERLWLTDGRFVPCKDLIGKNFETWTVDHASNEILPVQAEASNNGVAHCLRIITQMGRTLIRTDEHPLYTWNGWCDADKLHVGQSIALPRYVPQPIEPRKMPSELVRFLAYMIAEGACGGKGSLSWSQNPGNVLDDMRAITQTLGIEMWQPSYNEGTCDWRIGSVGKAICTQYGLYGRLSHQHRVPDEIFQLSNTQIAEFISALIDTDGCISTCANGSTGRVQIDYNTISYKLAEDVVALYNRLGMHPYLTHRYAPGRFVDQVYVVTLSSSDDIKAMAKVLTLRGKNRQMQDALAVAESRTIHRASQADTFPKEAWPEFITAVDATHDLTWAQLGYQQRPVPSTWALRRDLAERIVARTDNLYLSQKVAQPLVWDKIVAIEDAGAWNTVAIHVPGPQTYLATEYSHNSIKTALSGLILRWVSETWGGQQECYALASDMEQSRGRVYQAFLTSIEKDPRYDMTKRLLPSPSEAGGSEYPVWRIIERDSKHLPTGSIVRAVSADYRGEAGSNPTISAWTELWALRLEKDKRLWDELTVPPTRPRGMRIVDTYAGYRGESNVLWDLWQRIQKDGRRIQADEPLGIAWNNAMKLMFMQYRTLPDRPDLQDLLLPDIEDPPLWYNEAAQSFGYIDQGRQGRRLPWQLGSVGDAYYAEEYASLRSEAYTRLHENEWPDPVNALIPIEWWHNCYDPLLKVSPNANYDAALRRTPMVLGVDAGLSGDCAAIVGVTRHPTKHHEVAVRHCRVFVPPRGGKLNYGDTIEAELRQLCKRYNVVQIAYDEWQLHHLMTELGQGIRGHEDYDKRKPVAWVRQFNQANPRRIADAQLVQMIREQQIHHDGTMPDLEEHFLGASAQMSPTEDTRLKIVKRDTDSKIDAVVALSMANRECLRLNL